MPNSSFNINLPTNKSNPTRTHTIAMDEQQLNFIRKCIELALITSSELKEEQDTYQEPVGPLLVKMITDTCS
ncbi:MAG: hypothetical protein ACXW07_09760, partial [Nitrososphaeraceae archaeon]